MIRPISSLLIFLSSVTTAAAQNRSQFEITGSVTGVKDNTVLYLELREENQKVLDSTYVVAGKFSFTGQLESSVAKVMIRTRDFTDYKFFWLENSAITFSAETGKFRQAVITGSKTQDKQNELDALLAGVPRSQRLDKEKLFVHNHPNSLVSASILSTYSATWGKDTTTVLYNRLSDEMKKTSYGKSVFEFISLNKNLKAGDRYADFSQEDTHNKLVSLSDFHGKIVLLEFWGSWCGPCRATNPELVQLYNEFKDKGFEILGVAAETSRDAWLRAIEKDKLTWPNVTDLQGDKNKAALMYGVSGYPSNFLIDKDGIIISRDLRGVELKQKLQQVLNSK